VAPLVDSINGLLGRLGGALARQREFVADAAHELRTPLTALRLQLQLAERASDPLEREQAHARLREGIARATRLVEQLLALARAEPDAATPREPIDLAGVVRAIGASHDANARSRGLDLVIEAGDPIPVLAHGGALETLVETLLDNAIRYTPAGRVVLRALRQGRHALLEIDDTGPGIPAAERERVFDRFYRGPDAPEGGSGLGLAIARRIAEAHGGAIHLEDAPAGSGLRVRVELPLSPA
jgi:signal transduction histidine kinase